MPSTTDGSAFGAASRVDLLGEVLLKAHPLDGVELALEPVRVFLLVADHLLEDGGGAVVAEVVAESHGRRGGPLRGG